MEDLANLFSALKCPKCSNIDYLQIEEKTDKKKWLVTFISIKYNCRYKNETYTPNPVEVMEKRH